MKIITRGEAMRIHRQHPASRGGNQVFSFAEHGLL
ncbi:DUF987 family protein [Escherichia coli]|nr:DUF987 family protein [Escherichia coli]